MRATVAINPRILAWAIHRADTTVKILAKTILKPPGVKSRTNGKATPHLLKKSASSIRLSLPAGASKRKPSVSLSQPDYKDV